MVLLRAQGSGNNLCSKNRLMEKHI